MKKVKLILSFLWLILAIVTYIYFTSIIKYPKSDSLDDFIGLFLIFLVPVFFVLYYFLSEENRKKLIEIVFCIFLVINVLYYYCSFMTMSFYPINVSETKDYSNYLDFDEVSENSDLIKGVFPKEIPDNAADIEYHYKAYPSKNSMFVEAYWTLPEKEHESEEFRVQLLSETKLVYDSVTYYYINIGDGYCHVCFGEEDNSVSYFADINDCCNWQNIIWIKSEFMEIN